MITYTLFSCPTFTAGISSSQSCLKNCLFFLRDHKYFQGTQYTYGSWINTYVWAYKSQKMAWTMQYDKPQVPELVMHNSIFDNDVLKNKLLPYVARKCYELSILILFTVLNINYVFRVHQEISSCFVKIFYV